MLHFAGMDSSLQTETNIREPDPWVHSDEDVLDHLRIYGHIEDGSQLFQGPPWKSKQSSASSTFETSDHYI